MEGLTGKTTKNAGRMGWTTRLQPPSLWWWCGGRDPMNGREPTPETRFGPCLKSQDFEDGRHRVSPLGYLNLDRRRAEQGVTHRPATANKRQIQLLCTIEHCWQQPSRLSATLSTCCGWRRAGTSGNRKNCRTTLGHSSQDSEVLPRPQGCNFHTTQFLRQNTNFSVEGGIRMESWHCVWGSRPESPRTPCESQRRQVLRGVPVCAALPQSSALSLCSRGRVWQLPELTGVPGLRSSVSLAAAGVPRV
ncbi:uncharacterized protein B0H64DRAFT_134603 [Chaetomium fimeti]|uniref:Uncharacterized protein n=1 Tax=Chaetomium fimeti TaxID=1854472 RepID=A0AAE0LU76_9PEZI|nr:hypothetical protein B0H64DRAFT_134603 [Chaetomium fimeti]